MKLKAPAAVAATARSAMNWFVGVCLAVFLTTSSASAAAPQIGGVGLNPAEQWVVAQATTGEVADLSKQFPEQKDRKLSAHFLEDLLLGALPGVKLRRHGVRIIGAIIDEPIDLENAQIPYEVWLVSCQFSSRASFANASFAQTVKFTGSTFKADAYFDDIKVGSNAYFSKTVFDGPVSFVAANIVGYFAADYAQFRDKEKTADFQGMKVGFDAYFTNAVFEGPLSFILANITGAFYANEAQFRNKEKTANFEAMTVGFGAFLPKTVFEGPANFIGVDFRKELHMEEAQFRNPGGLITFDVMKLGGGVMFEKALFQGPVEFQQADIAGEFRAHEAQFKNKELGASFAAMKVGGKAWFYKTVFEGPVDFSYAEFAWLDLSNAFWPKVAAQFHTQGMSYKTILAAREEPESHKALLKFADQSAFSADVYSNLEQFFLRQGHRGYADEAFIAKKRREREEYFRSGQWSRWLGSWMLDLLVGYGRRPWQAGIPCAVLVALGCVFFSPNKMEPQKLEDTPLVYNRFWYSLGLFLPFVNLHVDNVWKPKADQAFLRNYMRVHILLGWILVPLVLAALTGLIK
jgi:uncharacterized protein YjbI with pentapeptide repeats